MAPANDNTQLLNDSVQGNLEARLQLDTAIYDELRQLAAKQMNREYPGHSLRPTGLVHEVFLKMIDQQKVEFLGRTHFLSIAAIAMRRILVDRARKNKRLKRGGEFNRVLWNDELVISRANDGDVLDVNEALDRLSELDPQQAKIVELRFFGGMTVDEVANSMELSRRTVEREWTMAKAWLRQELSKDESQ